MKDMSKYKCRDFLCSIVHNRIRLIDRDSDCSLDALNGLLKRDQRACRIRWRHEDFDVEESG